MTPASRFRLLERLAALAGQSVQALQAAVVFLTRVPLPFPARPPADITVRAMAAFPLVGGLVGGAMAAVYGLAVGVAGWPPPVAALLTLGGGALLTGALHEDGLADAADGLGGGRDAAHALSIMRDSRIGSYGVVALFLVLGLRLAALAALVEPVRVVVALVAAESFSRAILPGLGYFFPPARRDGLGVSHGRASGGVAGLAGGIGLAILAGLVAVGGLGVGQAVVVAGGGVAVAAAMGRLGMARLGGVTGDLLGASQQLAATLILLLLARG